jgi:tetratricopeptide (TPR) repeat protein
MAEQLPPVFSPEIPADVEHVPLIREEALDWLETHHAGDRVFTTGELLAMAGERQRRWLISRLRAHGIADEAEISIPAAADALAVLFLRSRGVKFRDAVDAVVGGKGAFDAAEPRYGGVWNRLVVVALERLRRTVPARLLGSAVFALLRDPGSHPNSLVVVTRRGADAIGIPSERLKAVDHEDVYRAILARPSPSCAVISPLRELLFLEHGQLPARSEVTARHFVGFRVATKREVYELFVGSMRPTDLHIDGATTAFVGRILDLVFLDFEEFMRTQTRSRFETTTQPDVGAVDDLQLWLLAQLLASIYPGSLCEVIETPEDASSANVLASSAAKPWEPAPWGAPGSLDMLSGYAARIGVPLVVDDVVPPFTSVIDNVDAGLQHLREQSGGAGDMPGSSALALPIVLNSGDSAGTLYLLMPRPAQLQLDNEVRVLSVFARVLGEVIEQQRAARYSADLSASVATSGVLGSEQFRASLLDLLRRTASELRRNESSPRRDLRLPFLLLSAHRPDPEEVDPVVSGQLKNWLVETLHHLDWRTFIRSHLTVAAVGDGRESFMGELPGVGIMIALGRLVSKDELDRIRNAFGTINRISPTNSRVRFLTRVLDVPAHRIVDAANADDLASLAADVERVASDSASVLDDIAESAFLARDEGEWEAALKRVRKALQEEGGRTNPYLHRIGAECSFSLGDWPSALKYAEEAVRLSLQDPGSGGTRSLCQAADARLLLGDPARAWDLYTEAVSRAPTHPLPRYYRGHGMLLIARLLRVYGDEQPAAAPLSTAESERLEQALDALIECAMDDLSSAADRLDRWGLIPESYHYRNFHLVPTLLALGSAYLLHGAPGPAASRLQTARRSFPKDDLFFREHLFAKCCEQGIHRQYGALILGDEWDGLRERLDAASGDSERVTSAGRDRA